MIWGTERKQSITKSPEGSLKASVYLICRKCSFAKSIFTTNFSYNASIWGIWRTLACLSHIIRHKLQKWALTPPLEATMRIAQNRNQTIFLGRKWADMLEKGWKHHYCAWSKLQINNAGFFAFISPLTPIMVDARETLLWLRHNMTGISICQGIRQQGGQFPTSVEKGWVYGARQNESVDSCIFGSTSVTDYVTGWASEWQACTGSSCSFVGRLAWQH